ncbi:MAG: 5'/3'-nucleotidase SurE [Alphaproteobacteria bacterium]|nr:5'/3'-nucleotidase SurE [Alphaproteobacteria bacterium]
MRVLVSNDDGYDAGGVHALAEAAAALGEVWVVAPLTEQSGQSHSLSLSVPLRVREHAPRWFSVSGTPADCIYLALHELMPEPPALVLSGVNRGSNLGNDVHYSGTVAAAREAALAGLPAVAVSLHLEPEDRDCHWDTAVQVALRVARMVLDAGLPPRTLLNVNVPNVPPDQLLGVRAATLGVRTYENRVTRREDPWGRPYYWIGGAHLAFEGRADSDGPLVEGRWATVTPLHCDLTDHAFLDALHDRFDG